eukprot:scaffold1761_cov357-Prasinococcus_capsulatus_cf.AAC.9
MNPSNRSQLSVELANGLTAVVQVPDFKLTHAYGVVKPCSFVRYDGASLETWSGLTLGHVDADDLAGRRHLQCSVHPLLSRTKCTF